MSAPGKSGQRAGAQLRTHESRPVRKAWRHQAPAQMTYDQLSGECMGLIGRMESTLKHLDELLRSLDRPIATKAPFRGDIAYSRDEIAARLEECAALFPGGKDAAASAQAGAGASAGDKQCT